MRLLLLLLLALPAAASGQINSALLVAAKGTAFSATLLLAAGDKPHPTALLLNDLRSIVQNEDLAQTLRRAGWNVLYARYRTAPTPATALEDAEAQVTLLLDPANLTGYHIDAKKIVPIGFDAGAQLALALTVAHPQFPAAIALSLPAVPAETTKLAAHPVLLFSTEEANSQQLAEGVFTAIKTASPHSLHLHLHTDHTYATRRIAMQSAIVDWLARLTELHTDK